MSFWYTFLGVATAVAQVVLNLSPVPDICKVHSRKRVGELAALPLIAMVVNCHFWYVIAFAMSSDRYARVPIVQVGRRFMFPLFATQIFGQVAALVYNLVYYHWSVSEKRKELRKLYVWAFAMHCALTLYTALGLLGATYQSESDVGTYLGSVGIIIDVWMFSSPLGTLKHVMKTKSAASIPINLSLMLFVSTSLWVVSGMVDSDYFVAGLNAIGSLLSVVQIVFYMTYRPTGEEETVLDLEAEDESVVVVTPNAKTEGESMSTESPVYKMLSSPTAHRAG